MSNFSSDYLKLLILLSAEPNLSRHDLPPLANQVTMLTVAVLILTRVTTCLHNDSVLLTHSTVTFDI